MSYRDLFKSSTLHVREYTPQLRTICLRGECALEERYVQLPIPYMVFIKTNPKQSTYGYLWVRFAIEPLVDADSLTYDACFPNVDQYSGMVCLGGGGGNFESLEDGVRMFWQVRFSDWYYGCSSRESMQENYDDEETWTQLTLEEACGFLQAGERSLADYIAVGMLSDHPYRGGYCPAHYAEYTDPQALRELLKENWIGDEQPTVKKNRRIGRLHQCSASGGAGNRKVQPNRKERIPF